MMPELSSSVKISITVVRMRDESRGTATIGGVLRSAYAEEEGTVGPLGGADIARDWSLLSPVAAADAPATASGSLPQRG